MKRLITYILSIGLLIPLTVSCGSVEEFYLEPSVSVSEEVLLVESTMPIEEVEEDNNLCPKSEIISTEIVEEEYPIARYIWDFLQDLGYNDYVCAGIIGNMMVESGGNTLAIQPGVATPSYYGICQWSRRYYPNVIGVSLDAQCEFLRDNIAYEINTFGNNYARGFNYNSFLELSNEKDCVLAFAKAYERCASGSYTTRQNCATVAYNYFVNETIE